MSNGNETAQQIEPRVRVKQLANFERVQLVDSRVPIHRYFRSGTEMLRMADMYHKDGQIENAFILYSKYITLFVERIPKHPDYKLMKNTEKAATKKKLHLVFPVAEKLKSQLEEEYVKQYAQWLEEREKSKVEQKLLPALSDSYSSGGGTGHYAKELVTENIKFGSQSFEPINKHSPDPVRIGGDITTSAVVYPNLDSTASSISGSSQSPDLLSVNRSNKAVPVVDRSTKPRSLLSPGPETEYIHGLRMVVVPSCLMQKFICLAQLNTNRDIETCGILTGKMIHNQLAITHLLVPKQSGTSDSCSTDNEEQIFAYQDKHDLLTIGWIHTHPSQTAFMSSVDLHTHCSYQLVMPEAIAIVCSPKYKENGIFSLTEQGLDYIAGCREAGFHLHTTDLTIYKESPHVKLEDKELVVADMR